MPYVAHERPRARLPRRPAPPHRGRAPRASARRSPSESRPSSPPGPRFCATDRFAARESRAVPIIGRRTRRRAGSRVAGTCSSASIDAGPRRLRTCALVRFTNPSSGRRLELMIGNPHVKSLRLAALAGVASAAVVASFLAPTATPADAAPAAGNPRLEAQQAAAAWVKGHGNALERSVPDAFVRAGTYTGAADIYSVAYERTHEGLRVVGGDFVVLANADGQVVGSSVAQDAPVSIASTTPKIPADRATAAARARSPTRARRPPPPSWSSGTVTPAPGWRTRSRCAAPRPARSPGSAPGSTPTTVRSWSRASRSRTAPAPAPGRARSRSRPPARARRTR